jgi:hypothetical protein
MDPLAHTHHCDMALWVKIEALLFLPRLILSQRCPDSPVTARYLHRRLAASVMGRVLQWSPASSKHNRQAA